MKLINQENQFFANTDRSRLRSPYFILFVLWFLACFVTLIGLGDLPLRDFDEATVARVAYELSQKKGLDQLLPTLWSEAYLNKPPGLHWLIATWIQISNDHNSLVEIIPAEFDIRLIPALISTLIVPISGLIQWQLRPRDFNSSVITAAIMLTTLPVIRYGRMAMLDGAQLTVLGFFWLIVLIAKNKKSKNLYSFLSGMACSLFLLLKAPFIIPACISVFLSLYWISDFKKFWSLSIASYFCLGILPSFSWHIFHYFYRGAEESLWLWTGDGAGRVLFDMGEGSDLGILVPLIEFFEGGWPWLLLLPFGIKWAWQQRSTNWGRWVLTSQFVLVITIFSLKTQLPWYSHPLWLPFALICSPPLGWLVDRTKLKYTRNFTFVSLIPYIWFFIGIALILVVPFSRRVFSQNTDVSTFICAFLGAGWMFGGWLLTRNLKIQRDIGLILIFIGNFLALVCLMNSNLWLWELNENWPVKTIPAIISLKETNPIFIEGNDERPSLNWYVGSRVESIKAMNQSGYVLSKDIQSFSELYPNLNCRLESENYDNNWKLMFCKLKNTSNN